MQSLTWPEQVTIREQGPREGFTFEEKVLPTETKLRLIDALAATGLRRITAVCFVHPKWVPQWADAQEVARGLDPRPGVSYGAFIPNMKGLELCLEVGEGKFDEVYLLFAATEKGNQVEVNRSLGEHFREVQAITKAAKAAGLRVVCPVGMAFGCPLEGYVPQDRVLGFAESFVEAGADEIMFGDPAGMGMPTQVMDLLGRAQERLPGVEITAHFHNSRGSGLANALAALQVGVTSFDTCIAESGGSPMLEGSFGNICTEDLVSMLEGMGIQTGVDLARLIECAKMFEREYGHPFAGHIMYSGAIEQPRPENTG